MVVTHQLVAELALELALGGRETGRMWWTLVWQHWLQSSTNWDNM